MSLRRLLLPALFLVLAVSAHAGVLYSNLLPDGSYNGNTAWIIGLGYAQGDQFVATASGSATVLAVPFYAYIGAPDITFSLFADSGGNPGALLGTFGLPGAGLPPFSGSDSTTLQLVNVPGIALTAGSTYYLIAAPNDNTLSDVWAFSYDLGNHYIYGNGYNGSVGTTNMGAFELSGPAPEPGSLVLLGSGVIGLAGLLRRKVGM